MLYLLKKLRGMTFMQSDPPAGGAPPAGSTPPGAEPPGGTPPGGTPPSSDPGATPPAVANWTDSIADPNTKAWVNSKGFKDVGALAHSALNSEKLIGVPHDQVLKLPIAEDIPGWDKVWTRLGMPETADKYQLNVPEGNDPAFSEQAKLWFHEAKIPQAAASLIVDKWNAHVKEMNDNSVAALKAKQTEEETQLKALWGDQFTINEGKIDKMALEFGMTKEQLGGLKSAMGYVEGMKFMLGLHNKIADPTTGMLTGSGDPNANASGMSPEDAKAEIARLKKDSTFVLEYSGQAGGEAKVKAVRRMEELTKQAYPGTISA